MDNFDLRKYLSEGRLLKENQQNIYTVWVQTNDRFDRNFLVRANSEEEAQEIAKNDDDISWDEGITNIASQRITDEFVDEMFWEEDDWYNSFINDPSQQSYLYDAGT